MYLRCLAESRADVYTRSISGPASDAGTSCILVLEHPVLYRLRDLGYALDDEIAVLPPLDLFLGGNDHREKQHQGQKDRDQSIYPEASR